MLEPIATQDQLDDFFRRVAFCIACGEGGFYNFTYFSHDCEFVYYNCCRCDRKLRVSHTCIIEGRVF